MPLNSNMNTSDQFDFASAKVSTFGASILCYLYMISLCELQLCQTQRERTRRWIGHHFRNDMLVDDSRGLNLTYRFIRFMY